jgi:hypothetical protein
MAGCFLCGNEGAEISPYWDERVTRLVKCQNCGEYKISEQAEIEIANGIYQEEAFPLVAGMVFDRFNYKNEVKTVKTEDFRTAKPVTTLEKLYRLAKYCYTEAKKSGNKAALHRPACCYADSEEYSKLLRELKKHGIIDCEEIIDKGLLGAPDIIWRGNITLTTRARIAFERGIETAEAFEREFMNKGGDTYMLGPYSQFNQATDHATITATQNNSPNRAELQTLIGTLLAAVPKDTPEEVKIQIKESAETIRAEMQSPAPKQGLIKTVLEGLKNGVVRTVEFAAALAALAQFLGF